MHNIKEHIVKSRSAYQGFGKWLGAATLGALAMYLSDPDRGRRRRALAWHKIQSAAVKTGDAVNVARRDAGNRMSGMQARINRSLSRRTDTPDDPVLEARVRTKLGRVMSHPHAIEVTAQSGHVVLGGPILSYEKQQLLDTVRAVPGITSVEDKLEIHDSPDGISLLQGGGKRTAARPEFAQENWTPAMRCITAAGGAVLGSYGLTRRTPAGAALTVAGLALVARGVSNMSFTRLLGLGSDIPSVKLEKSIDINVPLETVFDVWTQYENFPHFMSHVLEVRSVDQQRDQQRLHWVVKGPAGARLEWDAVLTEYVQPTLLSWKTEPGAMVDHAGSVYFEPTDSGTRVTVRMSYRPPAGALGHGLAALLGSDPKQALDDDLMRMKAFIETGTVPHDATKPIAAPGQQPSEIPSQLLH